MIQGLRDIDIPQPFVLATHARRLGCNVSRHAQARGLERPQSFVANDEGGEQRIDEAGNPARRVMTMVALWPSEFGGRNQIKW